MASSICFPATFRSDSAGFLLSGLRPSTQLKAQRMVVRSDLDRNVSDMRTNGNFDLLFSYIYMFGVVNSWGLFLFLILDCFV